LIFVSFWWHSGFCSADPNSSFFDNQIPLWVERELYLAPLSREIIETDATSRISLSYPPPPTPTPTNSPAPGQTDTPIPSSTDSALPSSTDSSPPATELPLYITVGVVLVLAAIAFVGVLLIRKK
jgi:hypothetical protein